MRLAQLAWLFLLALLVFVPRSVEAEPEPDDVLGDIVVEPVESGKDGPRLMRLWVPPLKTDDETGGHAVAVVDGVLRRDLDLSGQFRQLDSTDPSSADRAEAVVRIEIRRPAAGDVELAASVFFDPDADVPAYQTSVSGSLVQLRDSTHQLVDTLMEALTGYRGPFVSQLTFVAQRKGTRSVYVVDADGFGLRRVTGEHQLASSAAIGPDDVLYYAASENHSRYRLYREGEGEGEPIALDPVGSIYGMAFSADRSRVALTIAVGRDVRLFEGPSDFSALRGVGTLSLTLSPTIGPTGKLAVAGTNQLRPRIWVDGRPASPRGFSASSPDFCAHPNGPRLVYALGGRRSADIVVADPRGRSARRITRGRARESHPACSPDGRLVAFFSDRRSGEGPGLYVMRIDGYHLRKIASVRGDSLTWSRTQRD